jgi:hypothetical protein
MSLSAQTGRYETEASFQGARLILPATSGFFKGRAFRAYREFTGAAVIRLVATKPFMLTSQRLYVDTGQAKATITVGGTAGGTFVALPTVFNKNGVVAAPTPDVVITQNGTATGGTEREVLRVNAGGGLGAVADLSSIRYLPAGTYYINITVTGSTSGVYSIEYEEQDA